MQQVKTIDIRGKSYVTVAERIRIVHEQKKAFEILESHATQVGDRWVWRTVIEVERKRYIGSAEVKLNAPKNTPDGQEPFACAETSAIGRALGWAGFGSAESIASFDEVYRALATEEAGEVAQPSLAKPAKILPGQLNALKTLYLRSNQEVPPDLDAWSFEQASVTILNLQKQLV